MSVFTRRCPFTWTETQLSDFWNDYLLEDDVRVPPFAHQYQDQATATFQYLTILKAIKHFKPPVKRLLFESTPLEVFGHLYSDIVGDVDDDMAQISQPLSQTDVANYFGESFTNVRDLHLDIVMDSVGCPYSLKRSCSALTHIPAIMKTLQSLSIAWTDKEDDLDHSQESIYLRNWGIWHATLFKNTWVNLQEFRLQDFRAPDELLLRFIIKHAASLRRVSLTGCFLGHSVYFCRDVPANSWTSHGADNVRAMLESLKLHAKLDEIQVRFSTYEGTISKAIWEGEGDWRAWQFMDSDWIDASWASDRIKSNTFPKYESDHFLLNCFLA